MGAQRLADHCYQGIDQGIRESERHDVVEQLCKVLNDLCPSNTELASRLRRSRGPK